MTDDTKTQAIEHAASVGRDRRWRRWMTGIAVWLSLSVAGLFVAAALLYAHSQTSVEQQSSAADAAQMLAAQVRGLGATPVVAPPTAIEGPPGVQGAAGRNGANGQPGGGGQPGAQGQPGQSGATGPVGSTGPSGSPGVGGQPGPNGNDGAAGEQGPQGIAGPQGADGQPGQPPAGWKWTDTESGATFTCSRDPGSPDDAPTYTCNSDQPPTTTTPPGLLGALH
jgi:hypothetical protein